MADAAAPRSKIRDAGTGLRRRAGRTPSDEYSSRIPKIRVRLVADQPDPAITLRWLRDLIEKAQAAASDKGNQSYRCAGRDRQLGYPVQSLYVAESYLTRPGSTPPSLKDCTSLGGDSEKLKQPLRRFIHI